MKPDLLLICPLYPATMAQLDAAYTVHRYYEELKWWQRYLGASTTTTSASR